MPDEGLRTAQEGPRWRHRFCRTVALIGDSDAHRLLRAPRAPAEPAGAKRLLSSDGQSIRLVSGGPPVRSRQEAQTSSTVATGDERTVRHVEEGNATAPRRPLTVRTFTGGTPTTVGKARRCRADAHRASLTGGAACTGSSAAEQLVYTQSRGGSSPSRCTTVPAITRTGIRASCGEPESPDPEGCPRGRTERFAKPSQVTLPRVRIPPPPHRARQPAGQVPGREPAEVRVARACALRWRVQPSAELRRSPCPTPA